MSLTIPAALRTARPPRRALAVPRALVRPGVYLLLALQAYRGLTRPLDAFSESYWLVNYSRGFIRRGMTGSLLDVLVGRPTPLWVKTAAFLVAAAALASIVVLVEMLLRRGTGAAMTLALLLVVSPFGIGYVAFQRRPDQLAVPLLVLLGLALVRGGRWARHAPAAIGMGFGFLVLMHEGVILEDLPWAVLLVVLVGHPDPRSESRDGAGPSAPVRLAPRYGAVARDLAGLLVPPLVALGAVSAFGTVSASTAVYLRAHAAFPPAGPTNGLTMFAFLPQSLHSAVAFVVHGAKRDHAAMLALGVFLIALHAWWITRWSGVRVVARLVERWGRAAASVVVGVVGGAAVLLFATGIDWIRWFAALGLGAMVTATFVLLGRTTGARTTGAPTTGDPTTEGRLRLPLLLALVAAYLVALAPLPTSDSLHGVGQLLLLHG